MPGPFGNGSPYLPGVLPNWGGGVSNMWSAANDMYAHNDALQFSDKLTKLFRRWEPALEETTAWVKDQGLTEPVLGSQSFLRRSRGRARDDHGDSRPRGERLAVEAFARISQRYLHPHCFW